MDIKRHTQYLTYRLFTEPCKHVSEGEAQDTRVEVFWVNFCKNYGDLGEESNSRHFNLFLIVIHREFHSFSYKTFPHLFFITFFESDSNSQEKS